MAQALTLSALARVLVAARVELAAAEQTLNSLNVFPVPDGDTGTNMRATVDAGLEAMASLKADERTGRGAVRRMLAALTRGAQGNSGVILSEFVRGCAGALVPLSDGQQGFDGDALARALHAGVSAARAAVDQPVEGTILSVAEAAAGASSIVRTEHLHAGREVDVCAVADAALDAAKAALARSPQQLDALAGAGVVDAGGAGLVIVLECLARVASGRGGLPRASTRSWLPAARAVSSVRSEGACQVTVGGPGFEVMGVVEGLDSTGSTALRQQLGEWGDSVVVAGGDGMHRVHVHTDAVLACVSAVREKVHFEAPSVTRFDGPLRAFGDLVIVARDPWVRAYGESLGARVVDDGPTEGAKVLADRKSVTQALSHSLVGMLEVLDTLVLDAVAAVDLEEAEEGSADVLDGLDEGGVLEVYQADSWRAARDLARLHLEGAEQVVLCLAPGADPTRVAGVVETARQTLGPDGALDVLRLDSGVLVQMGVWRE